MVQATWCRLPARSRRSTCFPTFSSKSRGEGGGKWGGGCYLERYFHNGSGRG
jgi:hypothetical protein